MMQDMKPPAAIQAKRIVRRTARLLQRIRRKALGINERVVTLQPDDAPRGRVLFSYILDPLLDVERPVPLSHTHFWESRQMALTFRELGFAVDCLHWTNRRFVPRLPYNVYVDVRRNFDRLAPQLPAGCVKVFHADTAHHAVHNGAQRRRLAELEQRRGIRLDPFKLVEVNRAAELADRVTLLGNDFTAGTFRYAGKPIRSIPISTPLLFPEPASKPFDAARKRFLWFGSEGFVHKGLDLVLDAFASMPEMELTVCGPLDAEPAFEAAYARELYGMPNIHTTGWIDIESPAFRRILDTSLALVYPSCSEGGGGCVVGCMHAGLIPVVTPEASVNVIPENGVVLPTPSVDAIRNAVRAMAGMSPERLRGISMAAWSFARANHTRERFAAAYRVFAESITGRL